MEDNYKKKKAKIILVAIVSLLVLVLGSAYAYFQVSTVNNFGTKNIYADTGDYGSVVIEGVNAQLILNLTSADLLYDYTSQNPTPVIYYAGTSGATTTPTEVTVGVARVNPNTDTNYYHCTYDISVTHTGTNDMYDKFNSKTNNVYDYTNRSEGQIALLINGVEYDWGSEDGMPSLIHADLYMYGTETKNITAGLKFVSSDQIDQSYITGTDIDIEVNIVPNTLRCIVEETLGSKLVALIEASEYSSSVSKYTGAVTDECSANSCTTVNSAQYVYYITSNDANSVLFEDFCWKAIRTTETGGVKLLYNGLPTTVGNKEQCTPTPMNTMLNAEQMGTESNTIKYTQSGTSNKPAYVGYMYNPDTLAGTYGDQLRGDNINTTDSLLKEKTEYWFSNSGIDESKVEDAVYCNDRSLLSTSPVTEANLASATSGNVYFANRASKKTLECLLVTDSFCKTNSSAHTNYKVGFMSAPEARLVTSTVYYNAYNYWLGSPRSFESVAAYVIYPHNTNIDGGLLYPGVTNSYFVRPVVSASPHISITGGTGSTTDPFIFE